MNTTYPRPTSLTSFRSLNPRKLLPLQPPPQHAVLYPPTLPSPPRRPCGPLSSKWDYSVHIVPAAYPILTPYIPEPENESKEESKEARKARVLQLGKEIVNLKAKQSSGQMDDLQGKDDGQVLWNTVGRYVRKEQPKADKPSVSLLLAHANGFPKEIWEPFLAHLLGVMESTDVSVDEVWSFESVQHGDSALLNAGKLGILWDWSNNARDVLNFLLHHLPSRRTSSETLPTHLPRLPESESKHRSDHGLSDRKLVTIGHSLGGCTAALAAINVPKLFSSIIFVDPVVVAPFLTSGEWAVKLVYGAVGRRTEWASREEALQLFKQSPFFAAWAPEVLDVYIECGLAPIDPKNPNAGVKLKMPGLHEAVVFAEQTTNREAWELMPQLDESVALRWIMAGNPGAFARGDADVSAQLVWLRPANASNVCFRQSGHLIPQESPQELAQDISVYLSTKYAESKGMQAKL